MPCVWNEKSRQTRCRGLTCSVIYQACGDSVARGSLLAMSQGYSSSAHHTQVQRRLSRRKGHSADSLYYRGWHSLTVAQQGSLGGAWSLLRRLLTRKTKQVHRQRVQPLSRKLPPGAARSHRAPVPENRMQRHVSRPQGDAPPDGSTNTVSGLLGISPAESTLASD